MNVKSKSRIIESNIILGLVIAFLTTTLVGVVFGITGISNTIPFYLANSLVAYYVYKRAQGQIKTRHSNVSAKDSSASLQQHSQPRNPAINKWDPDIDGTPIIATNIQNDSLIFNDSIL